MIRPYPCVVVPGATPSSNPRAPPPTGPAPSVATSSTTQQSTRPLRGDGSHRPDPCPVGTEQVAARRSPPGGAIWRSRGGLSASEQGLTLWSAVGEQRDDQRDRRQGHEQPDEDPQDDLPAAPAGDAPEKHPFALDGPCRAERVSLVPGLG